MFRIFDHSHTYDDTEKCVKLFVNNLTINGYMIFHDYKNEKFPGGTKYMDLLRNNLLKEIKFIDIQGGCAIFQKI